METIADLRVERARRGDQDAFRLLVEEHAERVFRLAFRIVGDEMLAEDVVQETFLRAFRQLESFDRRSAFGTWVYRIAANAAIDLRRQRGRRPEEAFNDDAEPRFESPLPGPERRLESSEIGAAASSALAQLTLLERAAFSLRHFEGCSIAEISSALGIRPEASKQAVFRAVHKMRRVLAPFVRGTLEAS